MATVVQIVSTNETHPNFEGQLVNGDWHATYSVEGPKTICGIQLEGDDGYASGPEKQGRVTCETCRAMLEQFQSIKRWR